MIDFILPPPLEQQGEQAEPAEREREAYRFDIRRAAKPIVIISLYLIAFKSLALFYTLIAMTASTLYVLYSQEADEWINKNQIMLTGSALCFVLGGGGMTSVAGLAAGAWIGHVAQKILHQVEQRTRPARNAYQMAIHPHQTLSHSLGWVGNVCQGGLQHGRRIIIDPTRNACHTALQSVQTRTQRVKNWFSTLPLFRSEDNEDNESFVTAASNLDDHHNLDDDLRDLNEDLLTEDDSDEESDNEDHFEVASTYLPARNAPPEAQNQDHTLPLTRSPYARRPLHSYHS